MGRKCAHSSFAARAIIASIVACLIALQALIITGCPHHFASGHDGAGICTFHAGDKNPAHGHDDHSQCCLFCAASRQAASLLFLGALISVITYFTPAANVSPIRLFAGDFDGPPTGWTSSWSSRAPPPIL
jgi:hypothetical protein